MYVQDLLLAREGHIDDLVFTGVIRLKDIEPGPVDSPEAFDRQMAHFLS